jgi:hypothetical protein
MSQADKVFYLHEDDWGMISLVPSENLAFLHEEQERLDQFSAAHFDGSGWTDIYVRSEEPTPVTVRAIPYTRLVEIFGRLLPVAERVETGYSSYREPCPGCFAFGKPYDFALYGSSKDGTVTELSLSMQTPSLDVAFRQKLATALGVLGREYRLVVVDWQRSQIVDLGDLVAVERYLSDDEEEA